MTEFDAINDYLLRHGSKVVNTTYYHQMFMNLSQADLPITRYPGIADGEIQGLVWFFGHININVEINGVIAPANANFLNVYVTSTLRIGTRVLDNWFAPNLNTTALGTGSYVGNKRIYAVGFNQFNIEIVGFGAAGFIVNFSFNGYKFRLAPVF